MNSRNGALDYEAYIKTDEFKKQIALMRGDVSSLSQTTQAESKKMDAAFRKLAVAAGAFFSVQAAQSFISQMVKVRGEFQQLNIALETMLGSKEKADALMDQVKELAATTPFQLQDVAKGAKQLLAYGFTADEVAGNLRKLGDLAAGVSAPLGDIVYLYGTMRTQGRAYAQDIRQFTNRGIPIIQKLAEQFDVTASEVNKLVSEGKVGFPQIEKAINSMTGEGGKFFNLMAKQSKSLTGQISNLQDQFEFMLNDLGKSSEGFISGAIGLTSELIANYKEILKTLGVIIASYGAYKAAIIALNVVQKINMALTERVALEQALAAKSGEALTAAQARRIIITKDLTYAQRGLNVAMKTNPIGLVIAGITALIVGYEEFYRKVVHVAEAQKKFSDVSSEIAENVAKQKGEIMGLVSVISNQNAAEQLRLDAYNKLKQISPDLVEGYDLQSNSIEKLNENTKEYLRTLSRQAQISAYQDQLSAAYAKQAELQQERLKTQREIDKEGDRTLGKISGRYAGLQIRMSGINNNLKTAAENIAYWQNQLDISTENHESALDQLLGLDKGKSGGVNLIKESGQAEKLRTITERLKEMNRALSEQKSILREQRSPGSTATNSEIQSTLDKIGDLRKQLKLLQGDAKKVSIPVAPDAPDVDRFVDELREKINTALKNSKPVEVDESVDAMFGPVKDSWKDFFANISDNFDSSTGDLKGKLRDIQGILKSGVFKDGLGRSIEITPAQRAALKEAAEQIKKLLGITEDKSKEIKTTFGKLGDVFSKLSENTDEFNKGLSTMFGLLSSAAIAADQIKVGVADAVKAIKEAQEDKSSGGKISLEAIFTGVTGVVSGVGAAVGVVSSVFSLINQQRQKQIELQRDINRAQNDYNLALNESLRLNEELKDQNLIGHIRSDVGSAMEAMKQAQSKYNEYLADLKKGGSYQGQDFNPYTGGALKNPYNVVVGRAKWWQEALSFGSARDTLKPLLEVYPKLIDANGDLNQKLAETLLSSNRIDATTKDIIQKTLDWAKSVDAAKEQIASIVESLLGPLSEDLRNALVTAFEQGTDAAKAFGSAVEGVIENVISKLLFQQLFSDNIKKLQDEFTSKLGSGESLLPAIDEFLDGAAGDIKSFNEYLDHIRQEGKSRGIDLFGPDDQKNEPTGLAGAIQRSITEDTATELSGRINAMYLTEKDNNNILTSVEKLNIDWYRSQTDQLRNSIHYLTKIEANTKRTAQNSEFLPYLKSIDKKLSTNDDLRAAGG